MFLTAAFAVLALGIFALEGAADGALAALFGAFLVFALYRIFGSIKAGIEVYDSDGKESPKTGNI